MTLDDAEDRALSRIERLRELTDAIMDDAVREKNQVAVDACKARLALLDQEEQRTQEAAAMWREGRVLPRVAGFTKGSKR